MKNPVNKQVGPLKTFTFEGRAQGPCVVLFHGYGADAGDLIPLAEMMNLSPDVTWVFPAAPMQVIIAPGYHGKAWYQIDSKRLEAAMMNGEPADLSNTKPDGLEAAVKAGILFFDELRKNHNRIILGGFSQGAMLATEITLAHVHKPAGLIIMSGSLINQNAWKKAMPSCTGLPFIQTHGKNDVLLGYSFAENLFHLLTEAGMNGEFVGFNGGHEIPPKVIEKIAGFVKGICKQGR